MQQPLTNDDCNQLRELIRAYGTAWLTGDAEAVLRLFTEDAVLLPHHGVDPVIGQTAVRAFWWPPGSPPTTVTRFELTPEGIGGDGHQGYVWGRFVLAFEMDQDGTMQATTNAGTFMLLARRLDAEWRITHHMWDDPVAQVVT